MAFDPIHSRVVCAVLALICDPHVDAHITRCRPNVAKVDFCGRVAYARASRPDVALLVAKRIPRGGTAVTICLIAAAPAYATEV